MAWFGSLGDFPDLAGAVNKLSESVKNIEKNFDNALGFEENADESRSSSSSSQAPGLWPVISFMGDKDEETSTEKSESPHKDEISESTGDSPKVKEAEQLESPHKAEEKEEADTSSDRSASSVTQRTLVEEEKEASEIKKETELLQADEKTDVTILGPSLHEAEQQSFHGDHQVQSSTVSSEQENEVSELKPIQSSESSLEAKSEVAEVDQTRDNNIIPEEPHDLVVKPESTGEALSHIQTEYQTEPSSTHLDGSDQSKDDREISLPSELPLDEALEKTYKSVPHEDNANAKVITLEPKTRDDEIDAIEKHSTFVSEYVVPASEMDKLKKEMEIMEAALQGAARQAQAKADEIALLMNENENLKVVVEDLKRKSNEAAIESFREEYNQKTATLERKVYALTKERDTLRREQNRKSDAAVLLKEKDEIISQVMAEGEELSKKQAAQEGQIRKLRAQVRELEEEKNGLVTKLQSEENKVESIKKDKTATEQLLQETIEKHQADLTVQKEYYTNALAMAKEAEALAEARADTEARTELESRLKEAEDREAILVQALEELWQTLSRKEQQAAFREDMLRKDIEDLQKRYQASERRCEELVTQVPESTRPLLRQIEAIQETTARRAEAWAAVESSLNFRLQEAEAKATASEERERSMNERLSQTLSRINVLEAQISCLRAEQTQLSKSLEKERHRAADNRQEYLAAKENADTQEGRANQLAEEIKELRWKHKQELQDALVHREHLQQEVDKEKAARMELEKKAVQSTAVSEQTSKAKHSSVLDNGNLMRRPSSASSVGSMEESYFLKASLDSSNNFSESRNLNDTTISPYYMKTVTPSVLESTLRQKEGELASYISRLTSMESIRDSLAEELVKMTEQCEKLRTDASSLPSIRAELDALRRRHTAALELMGERDEELEELRADILDMKEMYREQVNMLVTKVQRLSSSMGNAS
ncbi:hypothetical protein ACFE04_004034 [Oxalis oulophora]